MRNVFRGGGRRLCICAAAAWAAAAAACLALPWLYAALCEVQRTGSVRLTLRYLAGRLPQLLPGAGAVALALTALTLLTARPLAAHLAVGGALCLASWVNAQKLLWRGEPLLPRDLRQIPAAADIARHLPLTLPRGTVLALLALSLSALPLATLRLPRRGSRRARALRGALALAALAALPAYTKGVLYDRPLTQRLHLVRPALAAVDMADIYYQDTFLSGFLISTDTLFALRPPQGSTPQALRQAAAALPVQGPAGRRRCDVIVVLLESFFTLDNFDGLRLERPLGTQFARLAAEGISGQMLTTGYGGGTANVEHSVLSGCVDAWLPAGTVPYIDLVEQGHLCYPQFLRQTGYRTLALHAATRTFYDRERAYARMGFDTFIAQEAFAEADRVGPWVGEGAALRQALRMYKEAAAAGPVFLHVVTMQGHAPNTADKYPPAHLLRAELPGAGAAVQAALSTVATGLWDIDAAIGAFADGLRDAPHDVVVLFFGDHQALVQDEDGADALYRLPAFAALPAAEQQLRTHLTPYLMWANFPLPGAGTDGGLLPCHLLLPTLLRACDAPRPAWMDWLAAAGDELRPWFAQLYFLDEKALAAALPERQQAIWHAQQLLQYDLLFGRREAAKLLYAPPAAPLTGAPCMQAKGTRPSGMSAAR